MNLKITILFTFFLLYCFDIKSQEPFHPKHTIILEAGGIGGFGSLNYERSFFSKENYSVAFRTGISFFRLKDYEREFNPDLLFPFSIHLIKKHNFFYTMIGIGKTVSSIVQASSNFSEKIRKTSLSTSFIVGFRFQKANKPFSFQINYTPIFQQGERFRHWGNIGFGYSFIKRNKL